MEHSTTKQNSPRSPLRHVRRGRRGGRLSVETPDRSRGVSRSRRRLGIQARARAARAWVRRLAGACPRAAAVHEALGDHPAGAFFHGRLLSAARQHALARRREEVTEQAAVVELRQALWCARGSALGASGVAVVAPRRQRRRHALHFCSNSRKWSPSSARARTQGNPRTQRTPSRLGASLLRRRLARLGTTSVAAVERAAGEEALRGKSHGGVLEADRARKRRAGFGALGNVVTLPWRRVRARRDAVVTCGGPKRTKTMKHNDVPRIRVQNGRRGFTFRREFFFFLKTGRHAPQALTSKRSPGCSQSKSRS